MNDLKLSRAELLYVKGQALATVRWCNEQLGLPAGDETLPAEPAPIRPLDRAQAAMRDLSDSLCRLTILAQTPIQRRDGSTLTGIRHEDGE